MTCEIGLTRGECVNNNIQLTKSKSRSKMCAYSGREGGLRCLILECAYSSKINIIATVLRVEEYGTALRLSLCLTSVYCSIV